MFNALMYLLLVPIVMQRGGRPRRTRGMDASILESRPLPSCLVSARVETVNVKTYFERMNVNEILTDPGCTGIHVELVFIQALH